MTVIEMVWNRKGWGFLGGGPSCEKDFWSEYRQLDQTNVGKVLTAMRHEYLNKHTCAPEFGDVLDVGVGGGAFCISVPCMGTDIDLDALAWLEENEQLWDQSEVATMTFWDSIEHIRHPGELLNKCRGTVLLSTPIYRDFEHCINSKHYKPGEHLWYFTDRGLKIFMAEAGFMCVDQNRMEESVGREDIGTYAFSRA